MLANDPERGPSSALKGWLSDIYFPALLDVAEEAKAIEALSQRLGGRATIDDPLNGRAAGLPALTEQLTKTAKWLAERGATYERIACTTGVDRDVTEGTLSLRGESSAIRLPVAVVAERRRAREVELRVYHATQPLRGKPAIRHPMVAVPPGTDVTVPQPVSDHVAALLGGRIDEVLASFEVDGVLRDGRGVDHARADGALRAFYERLVGAGSRGGGIDLQLGASADDGRICALECTATKIGGREIAPQAALIVFERGDSGLLRQVRFYDDLSL
jgi:hypothetical protein